MNILPKGFIGWTFWLMHGLETFVLTILFANIFGIPVDHCESLILLNCAISPALVIISFLVRHLNDWEAAFGLFVGVLGILLIFLLLPALNC